MPIEILELVIKAKVAPSENNTQSSSSSTPNPADQSRLEPIEKSVREIMEILKRKNER